MRRTWFLVGLMLTTLAAPWAGPTRAQDQQQDLRDAAFAAQSILQLAGERKFNAMYDSIHPDAHAIVPRVAAVGAFDAIYGEMQAGNPEVTDGRMVQWTWGVTGETYPYAAEIFFSQPFVDANGANQVLNDRMYLVEADGAWRWFFGSTPEFVTQVIQTYSTASETPNVEGDLLENVVVDLDAFWRDVLGYTDFAYVTPGVVLVERGDSVQTACGLAETGFWAFYCPPDQTVYLDESLLADLQQTADFAAAFVIGHEFAHHIQTGVGIRRVSANERPTEWNDVYGLELELMADCLTGAWALDLQTRGRLEVDDMDETIAFTVQYLGDPDNVDTGDPQAHGSAEMRVNSIMGGYTNGFLACNISV